MKAHTLSTLVGVGLRTPHLTEVLQEKRALGWFEVHSENYFNHATSAFHCLMEIREQYPISLHGVGLSLGSGDGVALTHLRRLKKLVDRLEPLFISEHLSWNSFKGLHMPDLFPLPYTPESFDILSANINLVQDYIGREIFIENPSSYIEYEATMEHEADFLVALAQKTGARLLIDVNNIYVSCQNHGWDAIEYINAIPSKLIEELHLAGHSELQLPSGKQILIDTHDREVAEAVWDLYDKAIKTWGEIPTLIEWDAHIPPLHVLVAQAQIASSFLNSRRDKKYA